MKDIYLLTDYKGYFGSKQKTNWYKSGMDKEKLKDYFIQNEFNPVFNNFSEIDVYNNFKSELIIYTSSEDPGYHYKDYIEDIILALELQGAITIPSYKFLRANNNKVFMELLKDSYQNESVRNIKSFHFGTKEELVSQLGNLNYPFVLKTAKGAMSKGVYLIDNPGKVNKVLKKCARTPYIWKELWDFKNYIKHKGKNKLTSKYRKKFIVQNFIEGLDSDWKILIYGEKYYALKRKTRKNDFRASGSGLFSYTRTLPEGLLQFAQQIYDLFNVPHLSIDVAYNGNQFFLIEYQAIYFGTKTLEYSSYYFSNNNNLWEVIEEEPNLEKTYVDSLCKFILKDKSYSQ